VSEEIACVKMESVDPVVVLRALHMAHGYYLVCKPVRDVLGALLREVPGDAITLDIVDMVMAAVSLDLRSVLELPAEFLAACVARHPSRVFRDAPLVVSTPVMLESFLTLTPAAVLEWVEDDKVEVHTENDVVYLLSLWIDAQASAGHPCTEDLLAAFAVNLRLGDCGPAYLQHVLPGMTWVAKRVNLPRLMAIRGLADARVALSHICDPCLTDGVVKARARSAMPCEVSGSYEFDPDPDNVDNVGRWVLGEARDVGRGVLVLNGFAVTVSLRPIFTHSSMPTLICDFRALVSAVAFKSSMQVGPLKATRQRATIAGVRMSTTGIISSDDLENLENGKQKVKVKVTISDMDMLGRRRA